MKIKIITNTFQQYHRQNVAVDSWIYLTKLYDNLEVINYQFVDEKHEYEHVYPSLKTKFCLTKSSKSLIKDCNKKLPCVSEIFENSLSEDCEYFIITNSDVIIMPSLIKYIIDQEPQAMACSRLDIEDIKSYDSIIQQQIIPVRWEIAGFDTFIFNKTWAEAHKEKFKTDYFLGKPKYDVVWAGNMKIYGDNTLLGNSYPPYCFHIHHGNESAIIDCIEKTYNENQVLVEKHDNLMYNIMSLYLRLHLIKRTPFGSFINLVDKEKEFEKNFFEILNVNKKYS
jgi:hypothetical protein